MATQSAAPPSQKDENTQNPEVVQPTIEEQHDAKAEATEDNLTTSVFVDSEPIRKEQVQNAVMFLSHPKVRGSPIIYRRSFHERKGLTKEEIDEAVRIVPDPTLAVSNVQPAAQNQGNGFGGRNSREPLRDARKLLSHCYLLQVMISIVMVKIIMSKMNHQMFDEMPLRNLRL
ncbi:peroxisomal membrane protein PEX14-like isoform X2 [Cornus florida]|uniref:peroxisomal membrane protein PEX14-like isoform X2 n=1 Tax=Cornus florida TaxID=4283 RepID=UPI0028A12B3E|nr:peroxisomal membrane protein PEX14-like isoform X2 [Cornus florida]XP_059652396.1 peroxisomal membrane protein PEX14-like isoform X2 [Cornus florida]